MLDRETAFCTEIFTTIIFMTVMHFDMLPSSENKERLLKHCGLYATAYLHNTAYVSGWKYGRKKWKTDARVAVIYVNDHRLWM